MDRRSTSQASIWSYSPASSNDWLASAALAPVSFNLAVWDYWAEFSELWWKNVFTSRYHHGHPDHCQLEVPDPIEEEGEHDLFA
ncbi:hypothetical protein U8326_10325 [Tsuneonella sp. CC-YZS046]|uniref:hypothetical protein n=1 Tax=Tsuneonella sp. CC-YZS046 TaxID=3042152 RepID=UPI002D782F83|nr:hypothetical protein [Tsuneonella sp. CC-YZS046]WRO65456.1 hypothetical protein U8326_10325 [Tsuneonella sp. CC-YZS046]